MVKMIGLVLSIVLGLFVAFSTPPQGLSVPAMWALGILVWGITCLIFEVGPDYVISLIMSCLWVGFNTTPFKTVFNFFVEPTFWLFIGALGLGVAAQKTGLLRRISLLIMNLCPATFRGQTLALFGAGTIISPLIPSITAKAAICAPLSAGISEAMGYAKKSKAATGLFGAMWLGFIMTGPIFLTGTFLNFMIVALLPKDIQSQFDWIRWFMLMIPWGIIFWVLCYASLQILYKPKEKDTLPTGYAAEQLAKMGKMGRAEKITLVVTIITLLFWMTERLHGINAAIIALASMSILILAKVFDRPEFRKDMPWDTAVFIGCIVGISYIFPALKIDKWMGSVLVPYLTPLASNPYLFLAGLAVVIYILRFALISMTATITIFTVMLSPVATAAGMSPWVIAITVSASMMLWNVSYQNLVYLVSYAASGELVSHKQTAKLCVAYMIVSIIAIMVSIPYWQMLGLIK